MDAQQILALFDKEPQSYPEVIWLPIVEHNLSVQMAS
jgi:hypothetical protein